MGPSLGKRVHTSTYYLREDNYENDACHAVVVALRKEKASDSTYCNPNARSYVLPTRHGGLTGHPGCCHYYQVVVSRYVHRMGLYTCTLLFHCKQSRSLSPHGPLRVPGSKELIRQEMSQLFTIAIQAVD